MSDNNSSTGSSGSSNNSWTILNPEDVAVESVGLGDDGTESLGDVTSFTEEATGSTVEFRMGDSEDPIETVLSEEGQQVSLHPTISPQVCQETAPGVGEGSYSPALLSPSPTSYVPLESDPESQPPIIHDIVTSSPSDNNDQLSAIPFVTHVDLVEAFDVTYAEPDPEASLFPESPAPESRALEVLRQEVLPQEVLPEEVSIPEVSAPEVPAHDAATDAAPISERPALEIPAPPPAEVSLPVETVTSDVYTDSIPALESEEFVCPAPSSPVPETIGSSEAAEASAVEETKLLKEVEEVGQAEEPLSSFSFGRGDTSSEEDGLRRRNVPSFEAPRRISDEEEEEEDVEFKLVEKKEEKRGFSLNKLIVAALVLLCLGSLFLTDDLDSSEMGDGDQDWINADPQDMKELLDKLAQENQQISQLEAQLQTQREELDSALKSTPGEADEKGNGALEKENAMMKEELSSLPGLKEELATLRSRVTELTQLTVNHDVPTPPPSSSLPPTGQLGKSNQTVAGPDRTRDPREELQRQRVLLEESRKRLEGMKKDGGSKKGVRESLSEIQKRLAEQVETLGKRRPWESGSKWDAQKGKNNGKDHWKKEEKREWRGEKDRTHGKDKHDGGWKSHKQSSHKEAWRRYQDQWDSKKDERRQEREKRKREGPWHVRSARNSNHHQNHQHQKHQNHHHESHQHQNHQHQHRQPHQFDHVAFWNHQKEKLSRNVHPRSGCSSVQDCATKEGLHPVELPQFQVLLEGYLSRLEGATPEGKEQVRQLTTQFFQDGVFIHDRVRFSGFAEDVADILEDLADILEDEGLEDDDALEEEMEEFPVEALWRFAVPA